MKVYQAINKVQADIAKEGIGKDRKNEQQGYKFRGIDDVYNALAPMLARHGLCILPRVTSREVVERTNAKGTALFYVTVGAEFDFVCAEDGSKHTVVTLGEAMDSGDKATNKAMSAAYKYACMQAFSIPTEGDNDADATTHEVRAKNKIAPVAVSSRGLDADPMKINRIVSALVDTNLLEMSEPQASNDWDWSYVEIVDPLTQDERLGVWNALAGNSGLRARIKKAQAAVQSRNGAAA